MLRWVALSLIWIVVACQDPKLTIQKPAPELAVLNAKGQAIKLEQIRDKPSILVFWSISCVACLAEMPMFSQFAKMHADQVRLVLINTDTNQPNWTQLHQSYGTDIVWLHDQLQTTQARYQVMGTPTFVALNAQGLFVQQHVGIIKAKQLEALWHAAL
tara:strand:+ start:18326 stop:18799 length:474 start_codon:yes stop_codon:yes gene_type:complete